MTIKLPWTKVGAFGGVVSLITGVPRLLGFFVDHVADGACASTLHYDAIKKWQDLQPELQLQPYPTTNKPVLKDTLYR